MATNRDKSITLSGKPLQHVFENWRALSDEQAAEIFQDSFQKATILPNRAILEEAKTLSATWGTEVPIGLMAVNDDWSVYAVGPRWIALNVWEGETVYFSELSAQDFEELGIPFPRNEV